MFNIFNKRKKLEEENKLLKDTIYNQEEEIKFLNDKLSYCTYEAIKDCQQETINTLLEQNKNMSEWIYKILKELGTVNTDNKHINIPIYTNSSISYYKMSDLDFVEKEYIEIPSITLIKQKRI